MSEQITFEIYSAKWCRPCKEFKREHLPRIKRYFPKVNYVKIDVDNPPEDMDISHVRSVPLIIIKHGQKSKIFDRVLNQIEEIEETLDEWVDDL